MRKLLLILPLLCLLACQKNFDEFNDTDQRYVTFSFDSSGYFSEVLLRDGGDYHFCTSTNLESGYGLRITGYCYDADSVLVEKANVFGDLQHVLRLKFKHLSRDMEYHFLFLSDVVEYDTDVDYYETWFQLLTYNLDAFYIVAFERHDDARFDMLRLSSMNVVPDNNIIDVEMNNISYNGFVVFTNVDDSFELSGTVGYYQSFSVDGMSGKNRIFNTIDVPQGVSSFVLPISVCYADKMITLLMKKRVGGNDHSFTLRFNDNEHRPFVATVDCAAEQITDLTLY